MKNVIVKGVACRMARLQDEIGLWGACCLLTSDVRKVIHVADLSALQAGEPFILVGDNLIL